MSLLSWLSCATNTEDMFVKIVHPGRRIELHDRPILAADIMLQYPKCCIAYPHVLRQPWAIVTPDTMLKLGQTFYVVPMTTLRKRQRVYMKHSPSASRQSLITPQHQLAQDNDDDDDRDGMDSPCCFFGSKSSRNLSYGSLKQTDGNSAKSNATTATTPSRKSMEEVERRGSDSSEGGDCRTESSMDLSESNEVINKKGAKKNQKMVSKVATPKHQMVNMAPAPPFDHWQPILERICEEHPY